MGADLAYRSLVLVTLAAAYLANYFADVALEIASLRSLLVFV